MSFRFVTLAVAGAAVISLSGCQEYFGSNDGYEDGAPAWALGGQAAGTADFEIVGATPSNVEPGDQVDIVMVSDSTAPVDSFVVEDFWFCTFDGESAMLETGGDSFEADVDSDIYLDNPDIELSDDTLDNGVISTVTFTVPDDTVTGEHLMFDPARNAQYFALGIQ